MPVIEARGLRKEYGQLVAVRDVDLRIEAGQVVGLIGPNGAGKTTLLKMLATLLRPTSGEIRVLGVDARSDYQGVRKSLGYMPDFFELYDGLTLDDCVGFFGRAYGVKETELKSRVEQALDYVELGDKRFERVQHLSRGMTQRLGVANLLVHDPALILLDEPASGLDPVARIQLRNVLKRLASDGKTILISSHILTELEELCSHVCAMQQGRIVAQGSIDAIRRERTTSLVRVSIVGDVAVAVDRAGQLPQVDSVRLEGGDLLLSMTDDPEARAAVNAALLQAGVSVCGLRAEKQGLEALFIDMTRKASA